MFDKLTRLVVKNDNDARKISGISHREYARYIIAAMLVYQKVFH